MEKELLKRANYLVEVLDNTIQTLTNQKEIINKILISLEVVKEENKPQNWNYKIGVKTLWDIYQDGVGELQILYNEVDSQEDRDEIEKFVRTIDKKKGE
jgi:hypothetical protein